MDSREFALAMLSILMGGAIVMTVIRTIARAIGQRRDHSALGGDGLERLDDRLGRMEQAIEAIAIEVERVSEGQRFTSKLLAERTSGAERTPAAERLPR
ncbi:MAG: hypothetical protein ABI910_05495 [Gemmatimonadota bacterium]